MTQVLEKAPTVIGAPFGGGFYVGRFNLNGDLRALIVSPKSEGGHTPAIWIPNRKDVPGASSFVDGLANTRAMAEDGSEIAQWAVGLRIAGLDDWCIPARDQLEMMYRALKPTAEENDVYRHGDNPSSVPVGYPYTLLLPGQTSIDLFRKGGAEALTANWHLSSTQFSADLAWGQDFGDGYQCTGYEGLEASVRAVRSQIIP